MIKRIGIGVFIVLVCNVSLFQYSNYLNSEVVRLNNQLHDALKQQSEAHRAVNRLQQNLGYGGFIHHFKNYVIRQDEQYLAEASKSIDIVVAEFKRIENIDLINGFKREFDVIKETIYEYREKLAVLYNESSDKESETPVYLDAKVKVNDEDAFTAIRTLARNLEGSFHKENLKVQQELAEKQKQLTNATYIAQPLLAILAFIYIIYTVQTTRLIREVNALFHVTPNAILLIDHNSHVIRANNEAQNLLGYSQQELLKKSRADLIDVPENDLKEIRENFEQEQLSGTRQHLIYHVPHGVFAQSKDKGPIAVKMDATIFSHKNSYRVIISLTDMTYINQLEQDVRLDALTQLINKMESESRLQAEAQRAQRYKRPLSFIFADIDYFKKVNDTYGHLAGDDVLKQFAKILKSNVRSTDIVGRFGGEEFVIICPESNHESAYKIAEKLRLAVESFNFPGIHKLTSSFGVSSLKMDEEEHINDLIKRADDALYQAKENGRNQVKIVT